MEHFISENCYFLNHFESNSEKWSIYKLHFHISIDYYKLKNNYLLEDSYKHNENINIQNIDSIIKTNEILYDNLNEEIFYFEDIIDKKKYNVFNINYSDNTIIFYCRKEDPFFFIQNWIYKDFFYYGNLNKKILIQLTHSTAGNETIFYFIPPMIYNINYNYVINNKKYLLFGFINNVGHHVWQEISGLINFLKYKENHNKIDGIIIGNYDYFNIKKILKEKFNFKIIEDYNLYNNIILDFYPVFLRTFFFNYEELIPFFNDLINFQNERIEDKDELMHFSYEKDLITFVLDIRTNSRILIFIENFYVFLIQHIYGIYSIKYKIKIIFTGRFLTKLNNIDLNNDIDYKKQINIVNDIITRLDNNDILFENLIGKDFFYIIQKTINSNIFIATGGTSYVNLINWIYNKKCIFFFNTNLYKLYTNIQFEVIKNNNAFFTPIECIKNINADFQIDYILFLDYFLRIFDSAMNI
jgi:hypothetical protein